MISIAKVKVMFDVIRDRSDLEWLKSLISVTKSPKKHFSILFLSPLSFCMSVIKFQKGFIFLSLFKYRSHPYNHRTVINLFVIVKNVNLATSIHCM